MTVANTSSASPFTSSCVLTLSILTEDYLLETSIFFLMAITLNIASCPFTILMNVLVIVAVKTRRQLQTNYNVMLACLAVTDLLVSGVFVQPIFAVALITALKGSLTYYCQFFVTFWKLLFIPFAASLFHLAQLSAERYAAMKFPFRYPDVATTFRIKIAVSFSWLACIVNALPHTPGVTATAVGPIYFPFRVLSVVTIVYFHISVYIVTRRHDKQIQAEQVSPEALAKFLKEKRALKTTTIIIGVFLLCYLPFVVIGTVRGDLLKKSLVSVTLSLLQPLLLSSSLINSFCNPLLVIRNSEKCLLSYFRIKCFTLIYSIKLFIL